MDIRTINLDEWVLSGGGAQGDSYFSKTDDGLILKLFNDVTPLDYVLRELSVTKEMERAGVPCPKLYEVVTAEGRYGHIGQRIHPKKSFARAAGDDPSLVPELAARMSDMAHRLHGTRLGSFDFPSFNSMLEKILDSGTVLTEDQKTPYRKCLAGIPDSDTLLHGDFHFGNVITDGSRDYFIDLGFFSHGDPRHDLAMFYFIGNSNREKMCREQYHMSAQTALDFWEAFKKEYYGNVGKPLPSADELRREMAPFMLLRTLIFEYDLGPSPELDKIREIIMIDLPEDLR